MGQPLQAGEAQLAQLRDQPRPVDPAAVAPYLGRYANPALGEIALTLWDGRLVFDAGGFRSELRPRVDEAGQAVAYIFTAPRWPEPPSR